MLKECKDTKATSKIVLLKADFTDYKTYIILDETKQNSNKCIVLVTFQKGIVESVAY